MGQIFVRGHKRAGKSVKSYLRSLKTGITRNKFVSTWDSSQLTKKYMNGYNALGGSRGVGKEGHTRGFDPSGFMHRTIRRAKGKKTSIYG